MLSQITFIFEPPLLTERVRRGQVGDLMILFHVFSKLHLLHTSKVVSLQCILYQLLVVFSIQ